MRHFDELINTRLYEKMDSNPKQDLRVAFDILASDGTGLGYNIIPMYEIAKGNVRAATNNITCNYERFMYMQEDIRLMCTFLDIPDDRFEFFKTVMNMNARLVRGTASVWK